MHDLIVFDYGEEPVLFEVDDPLRSFYVMCKDSKYLDRRIGIHSVTESGGSTDYIFVHGLDSSPSDHEIKAAIEKLKPRPYTK